MNVCTHGLAHTWTRFSALCSGLELLGDGEKQPNCLPVWPHRSTPHFPAWGAGGTYLTPGFLPVFLWVPWSVMVALVCLPGTPVTHSLTHSLYSSIHSFAHSLHSFIHSLTHSFHRHSLQPSALRSMRAVGVGGAACLQVQLYPQLCPPSLSHRPGGCVNHRQSISQVTLPHFPNSNHLVPNITGRRAVLLLKKQPDCFLGCGVTGPPHPTGSEGQGKLRAQVLRRAGLCVPLQGRFVLGIFPHLQVDLFFSSAPSPGPAFPEPQP